MPAKKEERTVSEMVFIQNHLNAPKNQRNNFGKYNYRSCEDILEALKPLLSQTGCTLTISDDIVDISGRIYVKATATLVTPDGVSYTTTAYAREAESKAGMDVSQITGAASSYARKYALNGLFCIDDNKDADALNTSKEFTQPAKKTPEQIEMESELEDAFLMVKQNIENATSNNYLMDIYKQNPGLHDYKPFMDALSKRKKEVA